MIDFKVGEFYLVKSHSGNTAIYKLLDLKPNSMCFSLVQIIQNKSNWIDYWIVRDSIPDKYIIKQLTQEDKVELL